jgi:hypothetical protein
MVAPYRVLQPLQDHINIKASRLLNVNSITRQLKRRKPFEKKSIVSPKLIFHHYNVWQYQHSNLYVKICLQAKWTGKLFRSHMCPHVLVCFGLEANSKHESTGQCFFLKKTLYERERGNILYIILV